MPTTPIRASTDPRVASDRGLLWVMAFDCHQVPSVQETAESVTTMPASPIERLRRWVSSSGMKLSVAKNANASRNEAAVEAASGVRAVNVPGGRIFRSAGTRATTLATAAGAVHGL